MDYKYGSCTRQRELQLFAQFFAFVGYEVVIANSYPTSASGIIVKYLLNDN